MEFRALERGEIELIWTIDRREVIENIYRLEAGELRLEPHNFDVPGWPPDKALTTTPLLYESFDRGAEFFGAFDAGALVGVAVVDTLWRGPSRDLLQLELLHVSRDYRARGVGSRLFEQARDAARARGARGLYISATPTENTIRFYERRGGALISMPDPDLYAREPEDIHLECCLTAGVRAFCAGVDSAATGGPDRYGELCAGERDVSGELHAEATIRHLTRWQLASGCIFIEPC